MVSGQIKCFTVEMRVDFIIPFIFHVFFWMVTLGWEALNWFQFKNAGEVHRVPGVAARTHFIHLCLHWVSSLMD